MKAKLWAAALCGAVLAGATQASAGVYTDDLSRCLVESTTAKDQKSFMTWMFFALALHPDVRQYANITPQQREGQDQLTARMIERLVTVDCRVETVKSLKYEGGNAIGAAFNVFGQSAARGLMSDAEVNKGLQNLATYVDAAKFDAVRAEAGVEP